MAEPHVITALVKRRAELAGEIEATHERLRQMVLDLENLDNTLKLFDPTYCVEAIRPKAFRPPKDWSNRGEMSRIILSVLRMAAEPLTTRDIALQLLLERALDKNDQRLLRLMTKRVGVALRGQRDNGVVRSDQGPGQYMLWEIAPQKLSARHVQPVASPQAGPKRQTAKATSRTRAKPSTRKSPRKGPAKRS
jgi:hypothetical protein